jgi:peroxiredoxin
MKQIIAFVLLLIALCGYGQGEAPLRVSGHVNDSLQVEGRQAYLFISYGNQGAFIDSVIISDGRFDLTGTIPYDEVEAEVIIDRIPESSGPIVVSKGDEVTLRLPSIMRSRRPQALGSKVHEELYSALGSPAIRNRDRLYEKLETLSFGNNELPAIMDSINYYTESQAPLWCELLLNSTSGYNAIYAYESLLKLQISEDVQKELWEYIVKKFKNNINIPKITHGVMGNNTPEPETTRESEVAFNRYARIIGDPLPYPGFEISLAPHNEVAYQVGDVVTDFALPSVNLQNIKLSDIDSDCVLVFFWASRNLPDLSEELSYLKSALDKYSQNLTILAISIDENLYRWQDAITEGRMESFTNVMLRSDNSLQGRLTRLFDSAFVPKNFLLDEERRIVAVNLPIENLEKRLKKIIEK